MKRVSLLLFCCLVSLALSSCQTKAEKQFAALQAYQQATSFGNMPTSADQVALLQAFR